MSSDLSICILASGSRGNCLVLQTENCNLMLDCGLGVQDLTNRLAQRDLNVEHLTAVILSHEHIDHCAGVNLIRKHNVPIYCSHGTALEINLPQYTTLEANSQLHISDIKVNCHTLAHDAREPLFFTLETGAWKIGILSDCGHLYPQLLPALENCDILMLEFNHDLQLLKNNSKYPAKTKARITGNYGHLSNAQASTLLGKLYNQQTRLVIALHLSEENNNPALVKQEMHKHNVSNFYIAQQKHASQWLITKQQTK